MAGERTRLGKSGLSPWVEYVSGLVLIECNCGNNGCHGAYLDTTELAKFDQWRAELAQQQPATAREAGGPKSTGEEA